MKRFYALVTLLALYSLAISQMAALSSGSSGFTENLGQIVDQYGNPNAQVDHLLHLDGMNVQLKRNGFSYDLYQTRPGAALPIGASAEEQAIYAARYPDFPGVDYQFDRIDVTFMGSPWNSAIEREDPLAGVENFYNVPVPVMGVRKYGAVVYQDMYPGIDVEYTLQGTDNFKYNLLVRPGADLSAIALRYAGGLGFDSEIIDGKVVLRLQGQDVLAETIPLAWYEKDGKQFPASVEYQSLGNDTYGFSLISAPVQGGTLVIDPFTFRLWGTYYGGTGLDGSLIGSRFSRDLVIDGAHNLYFTASTSSTGNIATAGAYQTVFAGSYDAMIVKFDSAGVRQWATYYGGTGSDYGHDIAFDGTYLYMVGTTNSTTGISSVGAFQTTYGGSTEDLFVVKMNASGVRQWASYYGGNGWDYAADITVDPLGNAIIGGGTNSSNAIATAGAHQIAFGGVWDGFLCKIAPNSTMTWGSYYGGTPVECYWSARVATDLAGNIYFASDVWGGSAATVTAGAHQTVHGGGGSDIMLAKFSSAGVRLWSTYYGGTGVENLTNYEPLGVICNLAGEVYISGVTTSPNNISTAGAHQPVYGGGYDAYLVKFSGAGVQQWGTYYGGTGYDQAYGISMDPLGNVYLGGWTGSTTSIATAGEYQTTYGGGVFDGFYSMWSPAGLRLWGSYYGGTGEDRINATVTDGFNYFYIFGETSSSNAIATPGSHQPTFGGGSTDAFLVKFQNTVILAAGELALEARAEGADVLLAWQVEEVSEGQQFVLERSVDAEQWDMAATFEDSRKRAWTDRNAAQFLPSEEGLLYYRLRSLSPNGEVGYSSIVNVFLGGAGKDLVVYPNPARGVVNVQVNGVASGGAVEILDGLGRRMVSLALPVGVVGQVDVSGLAAGMYRVRVKGFGEGMNLVVR
jgi:hypothetical protein